MNCKELRLKNKNNDQFSGDLLKRKFRVKLVRDILLVFFAALFLMGGLLWFRGNAVQKTYVQMKLKDVVENKRLTLSNDLNNLNSYAQMLKMWGKEGFFRISDVKGMVSLLGPVMDAVPLIRAFKFADDGGGFFMIRNSPDGYSVAILKGGGDGVIELQEWSKEFKFKNIAPEMSREKEVLKEPLWYRKASESFGEAVWNKPYVPAYGKEMVSTLSVAFHKPESNSAIMVAAVDVQIGDFFRQIESIKIGGVDSFLFDGKKYLFSASSLKEKAENKFDIVDITNQQNLAVDYEALAANKWISSGRPSDSISFEFSGEKYWASLSYVSSGKLDMLIGIVAPDPDLFDLAAGRGVGFVLIAWSIVLASIFLFLMIAYKYSHQIKDLASILDSGQLKDDDILRIISKGEGADLEFKSTMRMNLHTGKPGKEIEIAWLKTVVAFLNTEGGIILLGVDDGGNILGLDADVFENDDKCCLHFKNLIHQHIGIEHVPNIRFNLYRTQYGNVGMVTCEPSKNPVFLNNKNEEAFYIRSGPSTVQLPIRQALEYLKQRKG